MNLGFIGTILRWTSPLYAFIEAWTSSGARQAQPTPQDTQQPTRFEVSTATEDRVVPEIFGTHVVVPNLIHMGGVFHVPIIQVSTFEVSDGKGGTHEESQEQVVGYATFASFLYGIASPLDALTGWYMNDELAWTGSLTDNQTASVKTGTSAPQNGSGNSRSTIRFRDGTQVAVPEYAAEFGEDSVAYHRTSLVLCVDAFVGDNVAAIPPYKMRVQRVVDLIQPGSGYAGISIPEAGIWSQNPADLIFHVLTDAEFLGIPGDMIDLGSFIAAQEALHAEQLGLLVQIDSTQSARDLIDETLRHIDGVLYLSASTGLWTLGLIRGNYDVATLPRLTADHYSRIDIDRQAWEDLPTRIELKYLDVAKWEFGAQDLVNPANRFAVGAEKKVTIEFPYLGGQEAIRQAARRIQRRNWRPNATIMVSLPITLTHPTTGLPWLPEPGDVINLAYTDPKTRISFDNLVMRVTEVARAADAARVEVSGIEDIFATGGIDLVDLEDRDDDSPSYLLNDPCSAIFVGSANPELYRGPALVVLGSAPPTGLATGFLVKVDDTYVYGPFDLPRTALLGDAVPETWADPDVEIPISSVQTGQDAVALSLGAWQRIAQPIVVEHNGDYEIMAAREIEDLGGGNWVIRGLIRDVAGTGRELDGSGWKSWPSGRRIWIMPSRDRPPVIPISGALAEARSVKVIAHNAHDTSTELATTYTYNFAGLTPYPVDFLAGEKVGSGPTQSHVLTWVARIHHGGATGFNADNVPAFEAGTGSLEWEITIPADAGWGPVFVDAPTYERTSAGGSEVTYRVRSFLNGRFSEARDVTVPAD